MPCIRLLNNVAPRKEKLGKRDEGPSLRSIFYFLYLIFHFLNTQEKILQQLIAVLWKLIR